MSYVSRRRLWLAERHRSSLASYPLIDDPLDQLGEEGQKSVKYGLPNPAQESCSSFNVDICPDLLLAGIAAAGAAAFAALYFAATMNANGKRRRKRAERRELPLLWLANAPWDFVHQGMLILSLRGYLKFIKPNLNLIACACSSSTTTARTDCECCCCYAVQEPSLTVKSLR